MRPRRISMASSWLPPRSTVSVTGWPTLPRSLCTTSASAPVDHDLAVDRHDLVADRHAALGGRRALLHGADQDPLVVGALDRDADAAAAVALEAIILGLVGIGIAAVLVELLGRRDHRALDQDAALGLLQHRRGVDRGGKQLGQHATPGATVGRVRRASAE